MATIDIYDKGQVDALLAGKADVADVYTKTETDALIPGADELLPDYSGASADDVLTIENGAPVWKAGGSGEVLRATFTGISAVKDFAAWILANATPDDVISLKWNWTIGTTSLNLTGPALSLSEQTPGTNPILDGISIRTSDLTGDNKFVFGRLTTATDGDNKTFVGFYLQVTTSLSAISTTQNRQDNSTTSVIKATITKHTYTRRHQLERSCERAQRASRINHLPHFQ